MELKALNMESQEYENDLAETQEKINDDDDNDEKFVDFFAYDFTDYETNANIDVDENEVENEEDDDDHMLEYHTEAATETLNLLLPELHQGNGTLDCGNFTMDVDDFNNCLNNIFCMDDDGDIINVTHMENHDNDSDNFTNNATEITSISLENLPDINKATNDAIDDDFVLNIGDPDDDDDDENCSDSSSSSNNSATTTTTNHIHHNNNNNNISNNVENNNNNADLLNCRSHNNVFV